jgi:hypothetical protein
LAGARLAGVGLAGAGMAGARMADSMSVVGGLSQVSGQVQGLIEVGKHVEGIRIGHADATQPGAGGDDGYHGCPQRGVVVDPVGGVGMGLHDPLEYQRRPRRVRAALDLVSDLAGDHLASVAPGPVAGGAGIGRRGGGTGSAGRRDEVRLSPARRGGRGWAEGRGGGQGGPAPHVLPAAGARASGWHQTGFDLAGPGPAGLLAGPGAGLGDTRVS